MSINDNINSVEKLKMYKKLAESKDRYLLYVPELGYDLNAEVSEADLFREVVDFSKVAITAFADVIELKGGSVKDMSLDLCFYPFVNKEDILSDGFLKEDARPLKNYLGVMIDGVSGHDSSLEPFTIDDEKESKIITGKVYPVTYTGLVLGLNGLGFQLEGADDFNKICETALSDKVALGKVTYGIEREKVMVKSDR